MATWQLPSCLDLGHLTAAYPLATALTVQVPAPTHLRSDYEKLQIWPTTLPHAGRYTLHLAIAQLKPDTLLACHLILTTALETKTVWVIGRILSSHDPVAASNILPAIGLTPQILDFGSLKAGDKLPELSIHINNPLAETWQATLQALVPWLTVDRLVVRCLPRQTTLFTVRVNREVWYLPLGLTQVAAAVQLLNVNGTAFAVAARVARIPL